MLVDNNYIHHRNKLIQCKSKNHLLEKFFSKRNLPLRGSNLNKHKQNNK